MDNNVLLSFAMKVVPFAAFAFISILVIYKFYAKIRSKFDVTVNCWFCNQYSKVPYAQSNSWTCPKCEQYNGFTKDGDYNRDMFEQLDCRSSTPTDGLNFSSGSADILAPRNGLCNICNEAQRLKVEKLAQFEPKNEARFDAELKTFKIKLEEQYGLCLTCERHLNKVLQEKKKIVLGYKFLDILIKGTEALKPHLNHLSDIKNQQRKKRIVLLMCVLTCSYIWFSSSLLPNLTREKMHSIFGETIGEPLFMLISVIIAFGRVLNSYWNRIPNYEIISKVNLFFQTVTKLFFYTMGLKTPVVISFMDLYLNIYPFLVLSFAFIHHLVDGLKLTRFSFLLGIWSISVCGLIENQAFINQTAFLLLASIMTFWLSIRSKSSPPPKMYNSVANSFHKLYSKECISDEDSYSLYNQQLNNSNSSQSWNSGNDSFQSGTTQHTHRRANAMRYAKSPLTSSAFSLHSLARGPLSPNNSFIDKNKSLGSHQYFGNGSMYNFPQARSQQMSASSVELNSVTRPRSTVFGLSNNNNNNNSSIHKPIAQSTFGCRSKNFAHNNGTIPYQNGIGRVNRAGEIGSLNGLAPIRTPRPLQSPLSVSSSSIYPGRSSILSPTRFCENATLKNTASDSWISTNNLFNRGQTFAHYNVMTQHNCSFDMHRNALNGLNGMTNLNGLTSLNNFNIATGAKPLNDEILSRASSSQSSGFESQNERENSCCRDMTILETNKHFEPIEPLTSAPPPPPPPPQSTNYFNKHINSSVNYNGGEKIPTQPCMHMYTNGNQQNESDSFNFRIFNNDLPKLKRGDLLKKWYQSQQLKT